MKTIAEAIDWVLRRLADLLGPAPRPAPAYVPVRVRRRARR